jgi:hypothetical protein
MTTATRYRTPNEIASAGFESLVQSLGPGGALQFILHYERGLGDYTKERAGLLKNLKLKGLEKSLLPARG